MLHVQDLVKVYPNGVEALRAVSFCVERGLYGLLGPNGAGKTTLMRILAGVLEPTSGRLALDGEDVTGHPERVWPRLGYLPQYVGFYPYLSGRAMLHHLLQLKGVTAPGGLRAACDALLERVNLADAAGRKVSTYSGGMRQRLGIAQAIAGDPRLLIVDEPTAGLDPAERVRFYRLLAGLAEDRVVLLSTHIVEDVAMLCRRFAVLHRGRLLADTTPAEARAALDGEVYEGRPRTEALPELSAAYEVLRTHLVAGENLVRLHVPEGPPPPGFEPVAPTLEDAYLRWVREGEAATAPPVP